MKEILCPYIDVTGNKCPRFGKCKLTEPMEDCYNSRFCYNENIVKMNETFKQHSCNRLKKKLREIEKEKTNHGS